MLSSDCASALRPASGDERFSSQRHELLRTFVNTAAPRHSSTLGLLVPMPPHPRQRFKCCDGKINRFRIKGAEAYLLPTQSNERFVRFVVDRSFGAYLPLFFFFFFLFFLFLFLLAIVVLGVAQELLG